MPTLANGFEINGVIDTGRSVLENMNLIAEAACSWMTYDIHAGKWAVVINQTGASVASFDDTNIIGGINLSSTSLTEVYNSAEMEFPHKDLRDEPDYVKLSVDAGDRYPNEPDNILSINSQLINNPVQAQAVLSRQLKQSRVDKVISFTTDWSNIGLKAGDLITVTNTAYGFSSKIFRIISIEEDDADDGTIVINITALEYDSNVYSTSGLVYSERNRNNAITAKTLNTSTIAKDNVATTSNVSNSLLDPANTALIALLMNALTRTGSSVPGLTPTVHTFTTSILTATQPDGNPHEINLGFSVTLPYTGTYKTTYSINWGGSGSPGANGVLKNSEIVLRIGGTQVSTTPANTGDANVQLYEDHFLDAVYSGTQGQTITFHFVYTTDWGGDYGGNGGAGTSAIFLINGETKLTER